MLEAVIFDMDGLLFDTERVVNDAWKSVAQSRCKLLPPKMLDELRGTNGKLMKNIIEKYWADEDVETIIQELFLISRQKLAVDVPIKKGAVEIIKYLKANNIKIAIASSSPQNLIESNLRVSGLYDYFDVIVSGEQVQNGKPSPDIFLLAAKKIGSNIKNCIVIEDGINGVFAGINSGCNTYMVPDLVAPTKEILEKNIPIFKSLFEVKTYIENLMIKNKI